MKKLSTKFYLLITSFLLILVINGQCKEQQVRQHPLDIVFCLDLSGSTNGLINNLRDNLWLIINQANHMNPIPDLRIGVVAFSRPSFGKNTGYTKVLCDLTYNFDFLEAQLYKLKPSIERGDQIVSAALSVSVNQMNWSKNPDAKNIIFLCGNGMVTANGYEYIKYCEQAVEKNIVINTLYIPSSANMFRELPAWRRISTITKGMQSEVTVKSIDTVLVFQDINFNKIEKLNSKLNNSYLWVGRDSSICRKSQVSADSGAYYTMKDIFFNRVFFKTQEAYNKSIKDCELINVYTLNQPIDEAGAGEDFGSRLTEQKEIRNGIVNSLKEELPAHFIDEYYYKYISGKMPENNIFQRVVLTMLFKQWR